jgi:hypothetical protein
VAGSNRRLRSASKVESATRFSLRPPPGLRTLPSPLQTSARFLPRHEQWYCEPCRSDALPRSHRQNHKPGPRQRQTDDARVRSKRGTIRGNGEQCLPQTLPRQMPLLRQGRCLRRSDRPGKELRSSRRRLCRSQAIDALPHANGVTARSGARDLWSATGGVAGIGNSEEGDRDGGQFDRPGCCGRGVEGGEFVSGAECESRAVELHFAALKRG